MPKNDRPGALQPLFSDTSDIAIIVSTIVDYIVRDLLQSGKTAPFFIITGDHLGFRCFLVNRPEVAGSLIWT